MPSFCPLTDCTTALENEANIVAPQEPPKSFFSSASKWSAKSISTQNGETNSKSNSSISPVVPQEASFLKLANGRSLLISVKPAAAAAAAARKTSTTTITAAAAAAAHAERQTPKKNTSKTSESPFPSPRPLPAVPALSAACLQGETEVEADHEHDEPIVTTTPATTPQVVRHNPYAARCLDQAESTAEEAFEACYSPAAPASPVNDVSRVSYHPQPQPQVQLQLSAAAFSLASPPPPSSPAALAFPSSRCASPVTTGISQPASPVVFSAEGSATLMASPRGYHSRQPPTQPSPQPAAFSNSHASNCPPNNHHHHHNNNNTGMGAGFAVHNKSSHTSQRQHGGVSSPLPSTPASPSVRVTRKVVVSGGVDRSTGRPIPKCMSAQTF